MKASYEVPLEFPFYTYVWHFEHDAMARQLRQRRTRPAEADVQQLDERVVLNVVQLHQRASLSVELIVATISSGSNGARPITASVVSTPLAVSCSKLSASRSRRTAAATRPDR